MFLRLMILLRLSVERLERLMLLSSSRTMLSRVEKTSHSERSLIFSRAVRRSRRSLASLRRLASYG